MAMFNCTRTTNPPPSIGVRVLYRYSMPATFKHSLQCAVTVLYIGTPTVLRCFAHHQQCRRLPHAGDANTSTGLVGGNPCIDYSSFGSRCQGAGPTSLACITFIAMMGQSGVDWVINENVKWFPAESMLAHLGDRYTIRTGHDCHSFNANDTHLAFITVATPFNLW